MQAIGGRMIYAASDITNYLECEHLTALDYAAALGEIRPPDKRPPEADLAAKYGLIHEQQLYDELREQGFRVIDIPQAFGIDELTAAAESTLRYMRDGATHVAQATFFDGRWLGRADLLVRVDTPSALGRWSYEVLDAKLARRAKPYAILQLCFYSDQLERLQGLTPERMHLYLGTGEYERLRFADFAAYYRQVRSRFEELVGERPHGTYPDPVSHCAICRWNERCQAQRERDDHLSLVAGIRRDQIAKLGAQGIASMAALAGAKTRPSSLHVATFEKLRSQAELQVSARRTGADRYQLLAVQAKRGFGRLPPPSTGDVFFDMEGHPYVGEGLEYLFGVAWHDEHSGEDKYRSFWAHDHRQEKRALEEFVHFINERRRHFPDLHVYHYAPYEPSALKRLMTQRGACEDEIDDWLRAELFVDLYQVVHQALRASRPGYGLKEIESFYGFQRGGEVSEALQSIRKYEEYLATKDARCLREIEDYNRQDCVSAMLLRGWLLARRDEAARTFGVDIPFLPPPPERAPSTDREAMADELRELKSELLAGIPEGSEGETAAQRARWLMVQLLDYHRREAKPVWWAFFDRQSKDPHELVDDTDAIGDLSPVPGQPPRVIKQSLAYAMTFPPQQYRLAAGDPVHDPATGAPAGTIETLDDAAGRLELRRSKTRAGEPLPAALIPGGPIDNTEQRRALARLGAAMATSGGTAYRALHDILVRARPRIRGVEAGAPLQGETSDLERIKALVSGLDDSYVFIQGPPGSGKTFTGARLAVHLMRQGKRIGIASNSHKAINNLLREIERVASEQRFRFRGLKKCSTDQDTEYRWESGPGFISNSPTNADFPPADDVLLVAGTAWLFSRADLDGRLDYLFVDEAGQISLADALAMGTAARNVVLLGDPLQLAQVSLAAHPDGAGASVLEHLLGDDPTIQPDRGVFLEHTRRLHPSICTFIAEIVYGGRLQPAGLTARRAISAPAGLTGTGLRFIAVDHEGNAQQSPEEAAAVAQAVATVLTGTFTHATGVARPLKPSDVLVVTPYNMQVRCLKEAFRERGLPEDVRIGTVDKFQGLEAPVVFYSMATSSGEDLPRNLEFLFSRNRLNVAVSRAQCLAVLVASPRLLDARCRTVEQLQMVNALCRFVELARSSNRPVLNVPEIRIDGLGAQASQVAADGVNIL